MFPVYIDEENPCNNNIFDENHVILIVDDKFEYIIRKDIIKSVDYFNIMYSGLFIEHKTDTYHLNVGFIPYDYLYDKIINAIFCTRYSKTGDLLTFVCILKLLDFLSIDYKTYLCRNRNNISYGEIVFKLDKYRLIVTENIKDPYININDINPAHIEFIRLIVTKDIFFNLFIPDYYSKLDQIQSIVNIYFDLTDELQYDYMSNTFQYLIGNKSMKSLNNIINIGIHNHKLYKNFINYVRIMPDRIDILNRSMNVYFDEYIFTFCAVPEHVKEKKIKTLVKRSFHDVEFYYHKYINIVRKCLTIDIEKDEDEFDIIHSYKRDIELSSYKKNIMNYIDESQSLPYYSVIVLRR